MILISGNMRRAVSVLCVILLTVTSVFALYSPSIYIASQGTISYSSVTYQSELRGVLVKYLEKVSGHDDNLICSTLASYGINAVYIEVNPFAWTGLALAQFQSMIDACETYGLSVHVLVKYKGYDPTFTQDYSNPSLGGSNPDWRAIDVNGNPVNTICLQRNSTRTRLKNITDYMLTTFPAIVDINHDYVRYATTDVVDIPDINYKLCYCNECKAAFDIWLATNGKAPVSDADFRVDCAYPSGSRWYDFAEWRVNPINDIVRDVRQWALAINPNLMFTADTWPPYWGWTPDTWKHNIGQDPAFWISQGWIESLNPMEYTNEMARLTDGIGRIIQYQTGANKGAIPLVPFITQGGPGIGFGAVSIDFWMQEIDYLRQMGCNGFIIWRYAGPGFPETNPFTDVRPYLAAIRDRTDGGKAMFQTFEQSLPVANGAQITWITSHPTTGAIEYSPTAIFTATPRNGSLLPYVDIDYSPGIIVSESAPTRDHSMVIPLSPPFYYRIRDNDTNVELASPVYLATG